MPNVSFCEDTPNEVHYNPYVELPYEGLLKCVMMDGDVIEFPYYSETTSINTSTELPYEYREKYGRYISDSKFENKVISAKVGEKCQTVWQQVLMGCPNLTSLTIGDNVTTIKEQAFSECENLVNLKIGSGITSAETYVFSDLGVTNVTIPNGIKLGETFSGCMNLTSVTIGSGVTFGYSTFEYCEKLNNITSLSLTAPTIDTYSTFKDISRTGTLYVPKNSSGYDAWLTVFGSGWNLVEI